MSKEHVYSWRIDADLKRRLEAAAREEGGSVSGLLERITLEWLGSKRPDEDERARQTRLQAEAAKSIGSIDLGEGPYTRANIRERVRAKVMERRPGNGPPSSD